MICNTDNLLKRWQKRIGSRRSYPVCRSLAALGYRLQKAPTDDGLVDLRHVELVALYDEPIGRRYPALRLVGYGAVQVPHGVQWGGADNARYYKDLRIEPAYGGYGLQLNAANADLLQLALQLCSELYRVDRYHPRSARFVPALPRLWAGFAAEDAASLRGEGPELAALCEKFGLDATAMLEKFRREHQGLYCYPLEWVSEQLRHSLAVFVDVSETPRKQVFRLSGYPDGLIGFSGATAFDFYHSPLRDAYEKRLRRRRDHAVNHSPAAMVSHASREPRQLTSL